MSSKDNLRKFVRSISKGDTVGANEAFKKSILQKVKTKLEELKKQIAKEMFSKK